MQLLNEQRRQLSEEAQAEAVRLNTEISGLRSLAEQQNSEGRGLVAQVAELQAQIARGTQVLTERDATIAAGEPLTKLDPWLTLSALLLFFSFLYILCVL